MYKFTIEGITPLNNEPYPFSPLQRGWLQALESGKFKQGQGFLRDNRDGFCCLGVLCSVAGYEAHRPFDPDGAHQFFAPGTYAPGLWSSTSYLPSSLAKEAGLRSSLGHFARKVKFPGLDYGKLAAGFDDMEQGHASLGSMNDCRMIAVGNVRRAFTHAEIAQYIRHDPYNVLDDPAKASQAEESAPWDEWTYAG